MRYPVRTVLKTGPPSQPLWTARWSSGELVLFLLNGRLQLKDTDWAVVAITHYMDEASIRSEWSSRSSGVYAFVYGFAKLA